MHQPAPSSRGLTDNEDVETTVPLTLKPQSAILSPDRGVHGNGLKQQDER